MQIGVPAETMPDEKRVATVPAVVEKLVKLGFSVAVQSGAGAAANFSDDAYRAAGAEVVPDAATIWQRSDLVFKVRPPTTVEAGLLREGTHLVLEVGLIRYVVVLDGYSRLLPKFVQCLKRKLIPAAVGLAAGM